MAVSWLRRRGIKAALQCCIKAKGRITVASRPNQGRGDIASKAALWLHHQGHIMVAIQVHILPYLGYIKAE
jgi:hypothetical protein